CKLQLNKMLNLGIIYTQTYYYLFKKVFVMNKYCKEINQSLNEEINELTTEIGNSLVLYEKIIDLIVKKIVQLKLSVLKHHFRDTQEEINFFKNSKPNVLSKLIYYNAIYKIEAKKPYGGEKVTEEYLNNELLKIKNFFDNNLEFYKYYRTNSTYLDNIQTKCYLIVEM
ncbi:MAG: RteC domain-containing protein, partial [Kurthia sp.]|nr:RteC domain-containing protein [Candidatus Kurthia equi]